MGDTKNMFLIPSTASLFRSKSVPCLFPILLCYTTSLLIFIFLCFIFFFFSVLWPIFPFAPLFSRLEGRCGFSLVFSFPFIVDAGQLPGKYVPYGKTSGPLTYVYTFLDGLLGIHIILLYVFDCNVGTRYV